MPCVDIPFENVSLRRSPATARLSPNRGRTGPSRVLSAAVLVIVCSNKQNAHRSSELIGFWT
jgi:hypothetical protein